MQPTNKHRASTELPKMVPPDEKDLARAIVLLGNRIKSDLNPKARIELINLIGIYPSQAQATAWKQTLKCMKKINRA